VAREAKSDGLSEIHRLDERLTKYDRHVTLMPAADERSRRRTQLKGIGATTASASGITLGSSMSAIQSALGPILQTVAYVPRATKSLVTALRRSTTRASPSPTAGATVACIGLTYPNEASPQADEWYGAEQPPGGGAGVTRLAM
jgi:hypothetical protein